MFKVGKWIGDEADEQRDWSIVEKCTSTSTSSSHNRTASQKRKRRRKDVHTINADGEQKSNEERVERKKFKLSKNKWAVDIAQKQVKGEDTTNGNGSSCIKPDLKESKSAVNQKRRKPNKRNKYKHLAEQARCARISNESEKFESENLHEAKSITCKESPVKHGKQPKHVRVESLPSTCEDETRRKMMDRLNAARFRYINEQLYKMKGEDALEMFENDEESFQIYHEGFQKQVKHWPQNPLQIIIQHLKKYCKGEKRVIADFGCGDAQLARQLDRHKCHSFDLVALNNRVTKCDMADVPLDDETCDVAVFCLSLMGTNAADYLQEANRVLKTGGLLKIAEVKSRIENVKNFVSTVEKLGFTLKRQNDSNTMFLMLDFIKSKDSSVNVNLHLKPCLYKKR